MNLGRKLVPEVNLLNGLGLYGNSTWGPWRGMDGGLPTIRRLGAGFGFPNHTGLGKCTAEKKRVFLQKENFEDVGKVGVSIGRVMPYAVHREWRASEREKEKGRKKY